MSISRFEAPLTHGLGETIQDISDVYKFSEAELDKLPLEAKRLIYQIEDLASQLATLVEARHEGSTRYCFDECDGCDQPLVGDIYIIDVDGIEQQLCCHCNVIHDSESVLA